VRHRNSPGTRRGHSAAPGCGNGRRVTTVTTDPRNALLAGRVRGPEQVPIQRPGFSGRLFPVVTAPGQHRSLGSRRPGRERGPAVLPGDRDERVPPGPGRRAEAGLHGRAHGTKRKVPGQRRRSRTGPSRHGIQAVIKTITRIMNALAQRDFPASPSPKNWAPEGRSAVPLTESETGLPSSEPASRDAPGCPCPDARPDSPALR